MKARAPPQQGAPLEDATRQIERARAKVERPVQLQRAVNLQRRAGRIQLDVARGEALA
jgi:hypothetical protein